MTQTQDRIDLIKRFDSIANSIKISNCEDSGQGKKVILSVLTLPLSNYIAKKEIENRIFNPLDTIRFSFFPCISNLSMKFIESKTINNDIIGLVAGNTWIHFKNESIRNIPLNIKPAYLVKLLKESSYIEIPNGDLGWYTFKNPNNLGDDCDTLIRFNWAGTISSYRYDVILQKDIDLTF